MLGIELAALPAKTPLVAALATMQAKQQSAVVRVDGAHLALATAPAVVVGLHQGKELLSDLEELPEVSTDFVTLEAARGRSRKWITTAATAAAGAPSEPWDDIGGYDTIQRHFDREGEQGNRYVVASLEFGRAVIITAHEGLAADLGATPERPYCSCSPTFHNFALTVGQNCPKHGCKVIAAGQ